MREPFAEIAQAKPDAVSRPAAKLEPSEAECDLVCSGNEAGSDFVSRRRHVQSQGMNTADCFACRRACGFDLAPRNKPAFEVPRVGRIELLHPAVRFTKFEDFDSRRGRETERSLP